MSVRTRRVLRSLLFVPGNKEKLIARAQHEKEDGVILDLEDSVPLGEKDEARRLVGRSLEPFKSRGIATFVRINPRKSGMSRADLTASTSEHLDGIVLPKCESRGDVLWLARLLEQREKKNSGKARSSIIPLVETPLGIVNVEDISRASARIVAVAFGAADLMREMVAGATLKQGASWDTSFLQMVYPRSRVALAAAAAGVHGIDSPFFSLDDIEGLRRESETSRGLGYTGKMVIHPAQIAVVNGAFSPSAEEVGHARTLIAAYQRAERGGSGAISLEGRMIDRAMYDDARSLLDYAESIIRLRDDSPPRTR